MVSQREAAAPGRRIGLAILNDTNFFLQVQTSKTGSPVKLAQKASVLEIADLFRQWRIVRRIPQTLTFEADLQLLSQISRSWLDSRAEYSQKIALKRC
jgi:hypothetical protein